jgi:hypothetical protein
VFYHHPAPAAGNDALSMSSYFSHGGSSTSSSSASSFSDALAPAPPPADLAAQFDISEFFDDVERGVFAAPPAVDAPPPHVVPADSGAASAANAR